MPIASVVIAVHIDVGVVVAQGPLPVEAPFLKPCVARTPVIGRRRRNAGVGLSAPRHSQSCRSHRRRNYDDCFRRHTAWIPRTMPW